MEGTMKNDKLWIHTNDGKLWDCYFLEQTEHSIKVLIFVEDIKVDIQKANIIELQNLTQKRLVDIKLLRNDI